MRAALHGKGNMRKTVTILAVLIACLLAGGALLRLSGITPGQAATPSYQTAMVTRGDVEETVMAEGQLKPQRLVAVGAQVSGRITSS